MNQHFFPLKEVLDMDGCDCCTIGESLCREACSRLGIDYTKVICTIVPGETINWDEKENQITVSGLYALIQDPVECKGLVICTDPDRPKFGGTYIPDRNLVAHVIKMAGVNFPIFQDYRTVFDLLMAGL